MESEDKLDDGSCEDPICKSDDKRFIDSEGLELIKGLGIALLLSTVLAIGSFAIMIFVVFYGSPQIIIWSFLLLMLRLRICDAGIEISLQRILQKHFKISITFA